ncbi:hypothetical protein ACHAWO_004203 [Cyclotella atomus]|uniref:Uncharacterized protein n=1 Tax=Cyclotella atomus TaxID=382360 RepID=A0ABD3NAD0_9STRA
MEQSSNGPLGLMDPESVMESIQNCHMSTEESRRRLMPLVSMLDDEGDANAAGCTDGHVVQEFACCIEQTFGAVEKLVICLADCGLVNLNSNQQSEVNGVIVKNGESESDVYLLMASNCISKACEFITSHYLKLIDADSLESTGPLDDHSGSDDEVEIQACMARLADLTLRLIHIQTTLIPANLNGKKQQKEEESEPITQDEIVDAYAEYQRRCLRSRSKSSITSLAELRRVASTQNCFVSDIVEQEKVRQQMESGLHIEDEHDEDGGLAAAGNVSRGQPHASSITVILGEASSLIQPLAAWRDALPLHSTPDDESNNLESWLRKMCQDAMDILDQEAQTLAVTVGSWFGPDQRALTILEQPPDASSPETALDLVSMEAALEEMAFMCQVLSRYCLFSQQTVVGGKEIKSNLKDVSMLHNLLTEQSLHYSTLETRLATLQFNQALSLASPQLIELGRPSLKVPSIVEDAHFVCVRAIERATGTRSERAVWTVGHWVCEIWGLNQSGAKTVYSALMDGIGCSGGDSDFSGGNAAPHTESKHSFAASLLEAVEDDMGTDAGGQSTISPPLSGGILWGTNSEQSLQNKVDAELCSLNGFLSAANACAALSGLFADLVEDRLEGDDIGTGGVPNKASMLTFARDELASHSRSYHNLLQQRVRTLVFDLCGADDLFDCDGKLCLQNLRLFIEREVYNLNASSFKAAESNDRLESEIISPIRQSQLFDEVGKDKCDISVVLLIAEVSRHHHGWSHNMIEPLITSSLLQQAMSWKSSEIILQVLLKEQKEFNEWGAMLLSKQVRALQNVFCSLILGTGTSSRKEEATTVSVSTANTSTVLKQFARVNQAVSLLQLEKPSDWLAFAYKVGDSDDENLTTDEIKAIMSLRLDFSQEAIAKVCTEINTKKK